MRMLFIKNSRSTENHEIAQLTLVIKSQIMFINVKYNHYYL